MTILRALCARIGDGSAQIGWRIARWPWTDQGWRARTGRSIWMVFLGFALWQITQHYPPAMAVVVIWFLVKAYRVGTATIAKDAQDDTEPVPLTAWHYREANRLELIDTVLRLADNGLAVHLDTVFADFAERDLVSPGRTLSDFRRMCDQVGIPVRDSVKVAGRTRIGIHLNDLPDHSPADSQEDPVVE